MATPIPDELVGVLEGRKHDPHAITGENRESPNPGEAIVLGDLTKKAADQPAPAAEGVSVEDFLENKRKYCENQGKEFDEAKYRRNFRRLDGDNDGVLSESEWAVGGKQQKLLGE